MGSKTILIPFLVGSNQVLSIGIQKVQNALPIPKRHHKIHRFEEKSNLKNIDGILC